MTTEWDAESMPLNMAGSVGRIWARGQVCPALATSLVAVRGSCSPCRDEKTNGAIWVQFAGGVPSHIPAFGKCQGLPFQNFSICRTLMCSKLRNRDAAGRYFDPATLVDPEARNRVVRPVGSSGRTGGRCKTSTLMSPGVKTTASDPCSRNKRSHQVGTSYKWTTCSPAEVHELRAAT